MRIQLLLSAAATALMVSASALPATAAELVSNGGFESGNLNLNGWTLSGNTSFTGVTSTLPHSGFFNFLAGAPGSDAVLGQTLATVAGQTYSYSFWLRNDAAADGELTNDFSATLGGQVLTSLSNSGAFNYTQFSGTHVATANGESLVFNLRNDPSYWHLDDVSVAGGAVPEPAGWALMLVGIGALGGAMRANRRRRIALAG